MERSKVGLLVLWQDERSRSSSDDIFNRQGAQVDDFLLDLADFLARLNQLPLHSHHGSKAGDITRHHAKGECRQQRHGYWSAPFQPEIVIELHRLSVQNGKGDANEQNKNRQNRIKNPLHGGLLMLPAPYPRQNEVV